MGFVHPFELVKEEGCSLADVAAAFVAVERLLDMREIWAELYVATIDDSIRLSPFAQAAEPMTSQLADLLRVAPPRTPPGGLVPTSDTHRVGKRCSTTRRTRSPPHP